MVKVNDLVLQVLEVASYGELLRKLEFLTKKLEETRE